MEIFFYLFSSLLVFSSFGVTLSKNQVHSAVWLIFAFCNAGGLFLILGSEYIAMMLVIVYVGAVAVLFLFVVMLVDSKSSKSNSKLNTFFTWLFCGCFFICSSLTVYFSFTKLGELYKISPSKAISYRKIASSLYTDFFLTFQISGIALLVAMIGCISLTLKKSNSKKQNSLNQIARNKSSSIVIKKVNTGSGFDV